MLPISVRLSLVIALVVLLAVIVTSMLNVLKFEQVMEDFEDSRYTFVAHDIAHVLEQSLNLGLPLNQIDSAQQTLERQLDLDPDIASIAVFDTQGEIVFQVGRLPPGRAEAVLFEDQIEGDLGAESFSSTQIENSFGQIAGGVIVRHSADAGAQRDQVVLRVLSIAALVAALVGIAVVWFGSSQLLRPLRHRLTRATISLQTVGSDESAPSLETMADEGHEFEALAGRVLKDLRQTERDVDALSPDGETGGAR